MSTTFVNYRKTDFGIDPDHLPHGEVVYVGLRKGAREAYESLLSQFSPGYRLMAGELSSPPPGWAKEERLPKVGDPVKFQTWNRTYGYATVSVPQDPVPGFNTSPEDRQIEIFLGRNQKGDEWELIDVYIRGRGLLGKPNPFWPEQGYGEGKDYVRDTVTDEEWKMLLGAVSRMN